MKRAILVGAWIILLTLSVGAFAAQDTPGTIAIAAEDQTPAAKVSRQAGFSPFFLLFDEQGTFIEATRNPFKGHMVYGSGKAVVDLLAERGVTVIVAGVFGKGIREVITSRGIMPFAFEGNAGEAVKSVLRSK
jgi:predicted Fe-Mo cluster-binding NifX family protein